MSSKRNSNKKAWARRCKARKAPSREPVRSSSPPVRAYRPPIPALGSEPSELDQVGVVIVEEQLGLATTALPGLRKMAQRLPFEPCVSLLSMLAGRVETTLNKPAEQLALAHEFFGESELVERYRSVWRQDPRAYVFGPQSLYTLMRVLVDDAYDAPITQELTEHERLDLLAAVVASNSVIERGIDMSVGPLTPDLLAYELQVGTYYSRPPWMEEMARHYELYRLATEDAGLAASSDFEPMKDWVESSGLTALTQWQLGFALSAMASAWDPIKHPHVPQSRVEELLGRLGLADQRRAALGVLSASRAELQAAFSELGAAASATCGSFAPSTPHPSYACKTTTDCCCSGDRGSRTGSAKACITPR